MSQIFRVSTGSDRSQTPKQRCCRIGSFNAFFFGILAACLFVFVMFNESLDSFWKNLGPVFKLGPPAFRIEFYGINASFEIFEGTRKTFPFTSNVSLGTTHHFETTILTANYSTSNSTGSLPHSSLQPTLPSPVPSILTSAVSPTIGGPFPYSFVINEPNLCRSSTTNSSRVHVLVIVPTAPTKFSSRDAIRRTWGNKTRLEENNIKIAFLIGATRNHSVQGLINEESRRFRDVIQSDFSDSYMNLTLKSIQMLRWASTFCRPDFLLKCDDDMFVRIDNLLKVIVQKNGRLERSMFGMLIRKAVPKRSKSSKWFVTYKDYKWNHYPNYLSGTAYVISGDLLASLYEAALTTNLLFWEDIFVTGVLGQKVDAHRFDNSGFTYNKRAKDACAYKNAVTGHEVTAEEMIWLWNHTIDPNLKC